MKMEEAVGAAKEGKQEEVREGEGEEEERRKKNESAEKRKEKEKKLGDSKTKNK